MPQGKENTVEFKIFYNKISIICQENLLTFTHTYQNHPQPPAFFTSLKP